MLILLLSEQTGTWATSILAPHTLPAGTSPRIHHRLPLLDWESPGDNGDTHVNQCGPDEVRDLELQ